MLSEQNRESPDSRLERCLIIVLWIGILLTGDRLVAWIWSDLDRRHTGEFMALALLLGLALYLGVAFINLVTLRYTYGEGRLEARQGFRRVTIDMGGPLHLHRWRYRWAWSGGATRDLGVEEIDLVPPLGFLRWSSVWVLVGHTPQGAHRAVALRPSPRLLALLKEEVSAQRGAD